MTVQRSKTLLGPPYSEIAGPFGYAAAIETVGSVAAPLLAGFTFALVGLVVQSNDALRWPDVALVFLVLAALLLISAVQFSFSARRYYVPPSEWQAWKDLAGTGRTEDLGKQIAFFLETHALWLSRTRYAYNLGVMMLFFAVAISLVPTGPIGDASRWRIAAIALALFGCCVEVVWTGLGEAKKWRRKPRRKAPGAGHRH